MAKSRQQFQVEDVLSTSPTAVRSREWEGPARWTEYLGPDISPTIGHKASRNGSSDGTAHSSGGSTNKGLNMQWVNQLTQVAEGLMAKMYRFNQILDYPDVSGHGFSEAFWKSGVFPNHPKICVLLSKKFPEHHSKLQLERIDKFALDAMNDGAEVHLQSLEPWIQLLLDLMAFREHALRLILDLSSTVITLLPHQNSLILHAFMDLFCAFVRVNIFSEKIPRKMMLQTYNLLHAMARNDRDCDFYHSWKWRKAANRKGSPENLKCYSTPTYTPPPPPKKEVQEKKKQKGSGLAYLCVLWLKWRGSTLGSLKEVKRIYAD